jgi:signal transduction histidine kinase
MTWDRIRLRGITLRMTLLAWLVTILTLGIFVAVLIPEQKRDLQDALESKARGVAVSLQSVTAGAAVSEDYSAVVDNGMQVLSGDGAIDFLVVTKNDGFSVVIEKGAWKTGQLGGTWRPETRLPVGAIGVAPDFNRRVFRYSRPFDYNGIEWGWIHVGLSLDSYDRSVARIYSRTGLLAILCVALSLGASLLYARRLVKPILSLQSVVVQVARGDLTARVEVHSGDEVERLAEAFNTMADTIQARNRILESVRFAAQELLSSGNWSDSVDPILAKIGLAAGVNHAYVLVNGSASSGSPSSLRRFEWAAPGVPCNSEKWLELPDSGNQWDTLSERLADGQVAMVWPDTPGRCPKGASRCSIIATPVRVGGSLWGILGFDGCKRNREWGEAEKDSFQAVADMLGASVVRQQAQQALLEAKEDLELRVLERTSELQEQVLAKDRAHAELAEAQQRLIGLSRLSGMAEVATGVLHNVGNVLNSVNVSATIVVERLAQSRLGNLASFVDLIRAHTENLGDFLQNDPRGQRALPYLSNLSSHLAQEREYLVEELQSIVRHIAHIKEIVGMQQAYARTSGFIEMVPLETLVDDALRIAQGGFERHAIELRREFESMPPVATDKHKVLQILLNLVRNAKDSVKAKDGDPRRILIRLHRAGLDRLQLQVSDNGVGIAPENLTRIFSHGFTTKKDGHGFGLHSGALAAHLLGGSLTAESDGPGQGATFTLELPLQADANAEARAIS